MCNFVRPLFSLVETEKGEASKSARFSLPGKKADQPNLEISLSFRFGLI